MKIAIPTFGTRVSPRFDCTQEIAVVTVDEGRGSERLEFAVSDWPLRQRIDRLLELGVDTVICGGIDRCTTAALQSAGVTIYGWVAGEVEDALEALLEGDLDQEAAMQGGGRCRCRRFAGAKGTNAPQPAPSQGVTGLDSSGGRHGRGHPAGT